MPTLVFTSCMDMDRSPDQPVWDRIARCANGAPPDVLLLLGDQIYMDWGVTDALAAVPPVLRRWRQAQGDSREHVRHRAQLEGTFAADMHRRYAAQWAQPQFNALVKAMRHKGQILLAWDDHDFAWNNALGVSGQGRGPSEVDNASINDRVVPEPFKRISLALRSQFVQALRQSPGPGYPQMPEPACLVANDCAVPSQVQALGGFTLALLDMRWSRTDRDVVNARLLPDTDRQWLAQELSKKDAGLLILAGSTPMKHRSVSGAHDTWWAPPDADKSAHEDDRAYPEYALIRNSQRPVLYLGGDIHRNAWGGRVELAGSDGQRPPVVQALSSGAALGHVLTKTLGHEYLPCFGLVELQGQDPRNTQATVQLVTLGSLDRKSCSAPPVAPSSTAETVEQHSFAVRQGRLDGWVDDGECSDTALVTLAAERLAWQLAAQPLPVLAFREVGEALRGREATSLRPEQLDTLALTSGHGRSVNRWPTLLTASANGPLVHLRRPGAGDDSLHGAGFWDQAFQRARESGRQALVLFVHGFGKGFFSAMAQAAELRLRFAQLDTALFTWPSGEGGGLKGLLGYPAVLGAAEAAGPSLATAIAGFCAAAERHNTHQTKPVRAVLVARSMGALALSHAAPHLAGWPTQALARVVLHAPACGANTLGWLHHLKCERVAFINQNDYTLRAADWVHPGPLLGNACVAGARPELTLLDCTRVPGVGRSHDYLLRAVNQGLHGLLQRVLVGEPAIPYAAAGVPHLQVWPAVAQV